MKYWLRVGARIVCVRDDNQYRFYATGQEVKSGEIYTVRWIGPGRNTDNLCVRVEERERWENGYDTPFNIDRFRPVRTIDTTATVAALAQAMREAMKKGRVDA